MLLKDLTIGLLEALNDREASVQASIGDSLVSLGHKKPEFISKITLQFMNRNLSKVRKMSSPLIVSFLKLTLFFLLC